MRWRAHSERSEMCRPCRGSLVLGTFPSVTASFAAPARLHAGLTCARVSGAPAHFTRTSGRELDPRWTARRLRDGIARALHACLRLPRPRHAGLDLLFPCRDNFGGVTGCTSPFA